MENSPALLKRWITIHLRQFREAAGKSRSEVAKRLGVTTAQVGHLETAERLPSKLVLETLLDFYGVSEQLDDFQRIVAAARRGKNWWDHLKGAVPPDFDLFLGLESGAAELSGFDAQLVTGLLQTESYAEAVIRAADDLTDDEVQARVALRMGRQRLLDRHRDPVRLWTVLDEAVLYRRRGTAETMREQLAHLLDMSTRPRITVQVLPLDAGAHPGQQGGTFTFMRFPPDLIGDPGVIYYELISSGVYIEDPHDIAEYERALQHLRMLAATPEESRGIIQRAIEEVET